MDIARGLTGIVNQNVAAKAPLCHGLVNIGRGCIFWQGDQIRQSNRDIADDFGGELKGRRQCTGMIREHPGLRGLRNNRCHLVQRVGTDCFGLRLHAGHTEETTGDRVQASNDWRDHARNKHQRGRQEQHGLVGQRKRDVLGHHLTKDHVQIGHDQ